MSTFDLGPIRALRPEERDDAPVVGTGEFFNATWEDARKASNFDAHLYNYSNAFDGIADRVKAATGEALDNPFRSASFGQSSSGLIWSDEIAFGPSGRYTCPGASRNHIGHAGSVPRLTA